MYDTKQRDQIPFQNLLPRHDYSSYAMLEAGKAPDGSRPPLTRVTSDGTLYEVRTDPAATYIAPAPDWRPIPKGKKIYTARAIRGGYYPRVSKAPASFLADIVALFRENPEIEAHINLVYDRSHASYHLFSTQVEGSASRGKVSYRHVPHTDDLFVVAEVHSHHTMEPRFSRTDNDNELRSGVYGIIGRIDHDKPQAAFRYSCGGAFGELCASEIFMLAPVVREIIEEVEPSWPEPNQSGS
jgi:PRTRC genetic system protein A